MRPFSQRLAWLMAEMWYTWEKSAIGWPLERRKAFIFCWLSCLGFFAWLRLLVDESPLFVHSKITPTLLQLRPGASRRGGVLWAVTIWGCWRLVGHCFLWRRMLIVVSNIAMEPLTEQHDPGCWDFQNTVKNICWCCRKTQGVLLRKCNEITAWQISAVTHTSKVSELKTSKVWTLSLTHFIYALSGFFQSLKGFLERFLILTTKI